MERCIFNVYTKDSRLERVRQCTHSTFRIRTDIAYVGLGLINCVLIFLAFILLQSIIFVGYSAIGLDVKIFFLLSQNIQFNLTKFLRLPLLQSPFQHHVSGQFKFYKRRQSSARTFMLRGVLGNTLNERSFVRMFIITMSRQKHRLQALMFM